VKVYQKRKTEITERRFFPERIRQREVLVSAMIDEYLERVKGRMRSYVDWERYARHWKKAFAGKTLRQVVPGDIARYIARRRADGLSEASVNRELTFLRRVFKVAAEDRLFDGENPVSRRLFFKENNERLRYLTDDEEHRLREAIGEDEWPKVAFALYTGFRQGNQFRCRWADVNFETGTIRARKPKSGKDYFVPINDELRTILQALPSRLRSEWVFPSATGKTPLDANNYMHRVFLPALKRAKITDFHWHDARHTFASRLAMAGVDLRTVQELMGHQSIAMTQRYAHLSPAHKLAAVQLLVRRPTATTTATDNGTRKPALGAVGKVVDLQGERSEPSGTRTQDPLLKRLFGCAA
jgi:integrase